MATIGLDKLYYAPITESATGEETYGTPAILAKAISADLSVELAEATLYADDGAAEIVKEFKSGTLSLGVDDIGAAIASVLTGATIDSNQVIISASEDGGTPVAIGFRAKKSNGKYRYFWLYRVKFGIPATNLATKGDSITFSTPTIEGIGTAMAAIGTAAVAAGKKLYDMANDVADAGDNIDKMSQRLGLSTAAYQEWDYVLSQSGVDIDSVSTGMKTLTNTIDDAKNGTSAAIDKFERLGITQEDLANKSREDIFAMTIAGLQQMTDDTEKAALANDLFGRSGQEMIPLLNQTAESTQELIDKAHEMGMIMSDEAVQAAVD